LTTGASRIDVAHCTLTTASGQFVLARAGDAHGAISASAAGYSARLFALGPADERGPLTLLLDRGGSRVSGSVLDVTGGPIAGASVVARADVSRVPVGAGMTDGAGRFELFVPEGLLEVTVSAVAYSQSVQTVRAPVAGLSWSLVPEAAILGQVLAGGVGQAGVEVTAMNLEGMPTGNSHTLSAEDGSFELRGLPHGGYEVTAQTESLGRSEVFLRLGLGQVVAPVVIDLVPAAQLQGDVRVAGEPCPAGDVELSGDPPRSARIVDGKVQLGNIQPGPYRLSIRCSVAAPVEEDVDFPPGRLSRSWDLEGGLVLRGRVESESGQPLTDVPIQVASLEGGSSHHACATDSSGQFACEGFAPGQYEVSAGSIVGARSASAQIDLGSAAAAPLVLRLAAFGSVRATVVGARSASAEQVLARRDDGLVTRAEADGEEFVFRRLALGSYRIFIGPDAAAGASARLEHAEQVVAVTLEVPPQRVIAGQVYGADGQPALDAWVRAQIADPLVAAAANAPASAVTDDAGRFELRELQAGTYDLEASSGEGSGSARSVVAGTTQLMIRLHPQAAPLEHPADG
jgi:hypothetical protein